VYGSGAAQFMLPFFPLIVKSVTFRFFIVFNLDADDRRRAIATLTAFLRDGALVHNIAERVPLAEIARAHELLESGRNVGNVLLAIR
jgi:NADPH2:quinone reductase